MIANKDLRKAQNFIDYELSISKKDRVKKEFITSSNFQNFLHQWDINYENKISKIPLFNNSLAENLSHEKKQYFAKAFYHIRGHFHDFLWYMGNHAPDLEVKQIILNNIFEEFGENHNSHEQLYYYFAEALNVDIKSEIQTQATYEDYIVKFNQGHLKWLHAHDWISCLGAFAAYEHLDNVDYKFLSALAASFGIEKKGLIFFKIHEKVEHFKPLQHILETTWSDAQEKIQAGFNFIATHQLTMWQNLSERLFH